MGEALNTTPEHVVDKQRQCQGASRGVHETTWQLHCEGHGIGDEGTQQQVAVEHP